MYQMATLLCSLVLTSVSWTWGKYGFSIKITHSKRIKNPWAVSFQSSTIKPRLLLIRFTIHKILRPIAASSLFSFYLHIFNLSTWFFFFNFVLPADSEKSLLYVALAKTLLHVKPSQFGSYQNGWDACGFVIKLLQTTQPRESKTNI